MSRFSRPISTSPLLSREVRLLRVQDSVRVPVGSVVIAPELSRCTVVKFWDWLTVPELICH